MSLTNTELLDMVSKSGKKLELGSEQQRATRHIVLAAMRQNADAFQFASPELQDDEQLALILLKTKKYAMLAFAGPSVLGNRELMSRMVQKCPETFLHASPELRDDEQFVSLSLKRLGDKFLRYAGPRIRANPDIMLPALSREDNLWKWAATSNPEFMLTAAKNNIHYLKHAGRDLISNYHFICAAVQIHADALIYASASLKKSNILIHNIVPGFAYWFQYASKDMQNDKRLVLEVVKQNGGALEYASDVLKNDREIALVAVSEHLEAFEWVSETLQQDREILMRFLANDSVRLYYHMIRNPDVLQNVKDSPWLDDDEFVIEATNTNVDVLEYASKRISADFDLMLKVVTHDHHAMPLIDDQLQHNRDFVLRAVAANPDVFFELLDHFQDNKQVAMAVLQSDVRWEKFICFNAALRRDPDVALLAIRKDLYNFTRVCQPLRTNKEFFLQAVSISARVVKFARRFLHHPVDTEPRFAFEAYQVNPHCLPFFIPKIHTMITQIISIRRQRQLPVETLLSTLPEDAVNEIIEYLIDLT